MNHYFDLCLLTTRNKELKFPELWHQVQVPLSMQNRCVWLVCKSTFIHKY